MSIIGQNHSSEAGTRRADILAAMHVALEQRTRRRVAMQRIGALAACVLVVGGVWVVMHRAVGPVERPTLVARDDGAVEAVPAATTQSQGGDAALRSRVTIVSNQTVRGEMLIDDAQLQRLLAEANLPSGIIRVSGGTITEAQMAERDDPAEPNASSPM